jgi:hypothetical protein
VETAVEVAAIDFHTCTKFTELTARPITAIFSLAPLKIFYASMRPNEALFRDFDEHKNRCRRDRRHGWRLFLDALWHVQSLAGIHREAVQMTWVRTDERYNF